MDRLDGRGPAVDDVASLAVVKQRIHHRVVEPEVRVDRVSWRAVRGDQTDLDAGERMMCGVRIRPRGCGQLVQLGAKVFFDPAEHRLDMAESRGDPAPGIG